MSALALVFDESVGGFDLALDGALLRIEDGIKSAVILSLFADARAPTGIQLPAEATDRRGFWGDTYAEIEGDQTGGLLWTVGREKNLAETRRRISENARKALAWMVEDGVATEVRAFSERLSIHTAALQVEIDQPDGTLVEFRFQYVWGSL